MHGMIDHDLVRSGNETQTLEHAVVVIDRTCGIAVDVDEGVARRHLKAHRHGMVGNIAAGRKPVDGIRVRVPLAETQIIRMVETAAVEAAAPQKRRVMNDGDAAASMVPLGLGRND